MLEQLNAFWFLRINAPAALSPFAVSGATLLAEGLIFLVPLCLTVLWLKSGTAVRRAAVSACLAAALALFINQLIGLVWFHPRPFMDGIGHTYLSHAPDSSFPSDHVTITTAVGLTLWWQTSPLPRRWAALLLATIPLIAWARIYLGVHYPADVLGAIVVGACAARCMHMGRADLICACLTGVVESIYRRVMARPIARGWLRA